MTTLGEGQAIFSQLHQVQEERPAGGESRRRGGHLGGPGLRVGGPFTHRLDVRLRPVGEAGGGCIRLEVDDNNIDLPRGWDVMNEITQCLPSQLQTIVLTRPFVFLG